MNQHLLQRLLRLPLDVERDRRDMAALPLGAAIVGVPLGNEVARRRGAELRRRGFAARRVQPRAGGMGEGEIGVGRDRLVEGCIRARPRRQQQVDAVAVVRGGLVRYGGERQTAAIDGGQGDLLCAEAMPSGGVPPPYATDVRPPIVCAPIAFKAMNAGDKVNRVDKIK
jgi:hypothetical protein